MQEKTLSMNGKIKGNTAKKNYSEYVQDLIDTFDARKDFINEWKNKR